MTIEKELLGFKEKINNAQIDQSKAEGKKEQLMTQLKEKFKVPSIEKASKLLIKMKEKLEEKKEEKDSKMEEFKGNYEEALNEY